MKTAKISVTFTALMVLSLSLGACEANSTGTRALSTSSAGAAIQTRPTAIAMGDTGSAKQTQTLNQSPILVSFTPNPVPDGVDWNKGFWIYHVNLTETRGVGVTLNNLTVRYYSSNGAPVQTIEYNTKEWFNNWLPKGYLPANGKATAYAGLPIQPLSYGTFTYSGIDDNGNKIEATGRVDYIK